MELQNFRYLKPRAVQINQYYCSEFRRNLLVGAFDEARLDPIVSAVSVFGALVVHLVALSVGGRARRTPEKLALIVVRPAGALVAECLAHVAALAVDFEHVHRAVLALAGAVLGQIALVLGRTALCSRVLRSAGLQIAALPCRTARVSMKHAGCRVAARIVAVLFETAVALLARLDEAVPAYRAVEELLRLVPQTVVHPVLERAGEVLQRTRRPVDWPGRTARRSHYAPV